MVDIVAKHHRIAVWRMVLEMLSKLHATHFPGRRFGTDLELLILLGTAVALDQQHKRVTASALSRHVDMPRETARRNLAELTKLNLLLRNKTTYAPAPNVVTTHADAVAELIKRAVALL